MIFTTPEQFTKEGVALQPYGAVQHFQEITVGAGTQITMLDSVGTKWGGRTFDSASAWIKYDGTWKLKNLSGGTIVDNTGLAIGAVSNIKSIQGWSSTLTFSATDYNTVSWSSGTIVLSDGTTYSINAGSLDLATINYIYLDTSVSTTVLQTTTTASTAVGTNKILVCVANNVADTGKDAEFQVFGGKGGVSKLFTADNIAANSITANEIAANTITANQIAASTITATQIATSTITADRMNVSTLSSISANIGTITAGSIYGTLIQATSATTGINIKLDPTNKRMGFSYDNVEKAFLSCTASGNLLIDSDNKIQLVSDGAGDDIEITYNDVLSIQGTSFNSESFGTTTFYCDEHNVAYNYDDDGSDVHWFSGSSLNLRMKLSSTGNVTADGTFTGGGADFAEMFEATEEYSGAKIPRGTSVIIVGDKIRPCEIGEEPDGVISSNATIVGNAGGSDADSAWYGKYLRDDFGNIITEEAERWTIRVMEKYEKVTGQKGERSKKITGWSDEEKAPKGATKKIVQRPKLNPEWREEAYIPRIERPEWNIVGLLGRIPVLKGQPIGKNWKKLRELNNTVDEYLVK